MEEKLQKLQIGWLNDKTLPWACPMMVQISFERYDLFIEIYGCPHSM